MPHMMPLLAFSIFSCSSHSSTLSASFPHPYPDHRSQQLDTSHEESDDCESEDDRCSPSPVMDLTTAVTDIRSQRANDFGSVAESDSAHPDDQKSALKATAVPAPLNVQNYRSHDANWDARAVNACRMTSALPADSQDEPSSVNSPSECSSMSMSNEPSSPANGQTRKRKRRPQPIPEDCKDDAYWERRKRNNESAKRSREMRRMKEQQTTMRVIYLEQDNLRLKTEVDMLRSELEKVREILYSRSGNFH